MSIFSSARQRKSLIVRFGWIVLVSMMTVLQGTSQTQHAKTTASEPAPQPAIPTILAAFDQYEVVAMPEAHGMKDVDDFILALIRDPSFPEKVNDIEVECGNSLYQPILDRYIAGEDVSFREVRKVWRNTTQEMCGQSGFFEQFFPLVRAINQRLPATQRMRVLAGDPPINWEKVRTSEEARKFGDREPSIASVMEREVLSKHRKALMLFGIFHLLHGTTSAVATYEKNYPHLTFVISDLGIYDTSRKIGAISPFVSWPYPSLTLTKGTWLGALPRSDIFPTPINVDVDSDSCKVQIGFAPEGRKPIEAFVDALLYLGPQDFRLSEPMPADIALDSDYMTELRRRESLMGLGGQPSKSQKESSDEIVQQAQNPILEGAPKLPDAREIEQECLDNKKRGSPH